MPPRRNANTTVYHAIVKHLNIAGAKHELELKYDKITKKPYVVDQYGVRHPEVALRYAPVSGVIIGASRSEKARSFAADIVFQYMGLRGEYRSHLGLLNAMMFFHGCPLSLMIDRLIAPVRHSSEYKTILDELYLQGHSHFEIHDPLSLTDKEKRYMGEYKMVRRGNNLIPRESDRNYSMLNPIFRKKHGNIDIEKCEENDGHLLDKTAVFPLNDQQRAAVFRMEKCPINVITGGAGTGKTTTILSFLTYLAAKLESPRIAIVAFTGKAVARTEEMLAESNIDGIDTCTIHGLVMRTKGSRVYDYILVDEASMIDDFMAATVIRASERVTFIGDPNQLQPLGCGEFFNNIIDHVPTTMLNINYRADNDGLLRNLSMIYDRTLVEFDYNENFEIYNGGLDEVIDIYQYYLEEQVTNEEYGKIVAICSTNRQVDHINAYMAHCYGLYIGCPLMAIRNTMAYRNGQIFYFNKLIEADKNGPKRYETLCGQVIPYDDMVLGHAITVDKSQGSQFETVIFLHHVSAFVHRNRVYTALSRAQNKAIIVCQRSDDVIVSLGIDPPDRKHLFTTKKTTRKTAEYMSDRDAEREAATIISNTELRNVIP